MGNCVPIQQKGDPDMKLRWSSNSQGVESPVKDDTVNDDGLMKEVSPKPQLLSSKRFEASFRDLSNREMFFDSQAWLDSDCEDFVSINGDSPSWGTSPVHQDNLKETPQCGDFLYVSSTDKAIPEPSPTEMKKQLIELFRESNDESIDDHKEAQERMEAKPVTVYLPQNFTNRSPYESLPDSICSSERTPHVGLKHGKQKPTSSAQCCLPNLVRSLSFNERKKRLSPAYSGRQQ